MLGYVQLWIILETILEVILEPKMHPKSKCALWAAPLWQLWFLFWWYGNSYEKSVEQMIMQTHPMLRSSFPVLFAIGH